MNQDQLHKARQTRWRQDGNALLTLDDAERWLAETPLCLYLPRHQHLPVPAATFVEAIAGRPDPTPQPDQIAAASQMLGRLVASGAVIALNLFGSPTGIVGEQPDFLATPEALPYLYALQPQRNPKRPPSTTGASRVSPLAAESYQILEREGALTAVEIRERLGREVTEAATLRALGELWHALRVVPVPGEQGAPAHWELLTARHARELNIGSTQSQTTALSILVSFYLQSAIAATAEEAEVFLSPLASRSRIREVIHGLSATRQLASFSLNGEQQLYVEGTLPEIAEEEEAAGLPQPNEAQLDAGLEQNEPSFPEAAAVPPARVERKPKPRAPRPGLREHEPERREQKKDQRRSGRPSFADRARSRFQPRREEPEFKRPQRREGGFHRPERGTFRKDRPQRESGESSRVERPERRHFERPAAPENKFRRDDKFRERGASFERPPKRSFSRQGPRRNEEQRPERRPFSRESDRRSSDRGPERKSFSKDKQRQPFRRDEERQPRDREQERRPFRRDTGRKPFGKNQEKRPFRRRDDQRKPFDRDRRPRREDRGGQDRRPYAPSGQRRGPASPGSERRPFRKFSGAPSSADRPRSSFKPRSDGESGAPSNFRKPFNKNFAKPGSRPPAKGNFRFKGKAPDNKRPGGFKSQRPKPRAESGGRKPRRESGEGDEG